MSWTDNGSGGWIWLGPVSEVGVPEKPPYPPPSAAGTTPTAPRGGQTSVPAFSDPTYTTPGPKYDPNDPASVEYWTSGFKAPDTHGVSTATTKQAPTHNPFTGKDLVLEQTEAQTANLLVDPVTGLRFNPATGAMQGFNPATGNWEDGYKPPPPGTPYDPSAAAAAAAAEAARNAGNKGQDPSAAATAAARAATGQAPVEPPGTSTTSGPPKVNTEKIDAIMSDINEIGGYLKSIGLSNDKFSAAAAQLQIGLEQAQSQALAVARSGNRRDRGALERQALSQQTQLAGDASRSAALLRAEEEKNQKTIAIEALTKAGELGLNVAALDLNAQSLDMTAATAYLNNLFETERLGMTLDQQEAERVTNFVRDMALVAKDYYQLNLAERQSVRDDLTRRYGIDAQLEAVLAELDAQPGFWEKAALGLVGGAGQGATAAITSHVLK